MASETPEKIASAIYMRWATNEGRRTEHLIEAIAQALAEARQDGWRAGVDELVRILWSEQEVLVIGHNEDSVDEARVYAKPGHIIDDAGKVSKALESKAVPRHPNAGIRDTAGELPFVLFKDGSMYCATRLDFINLQESLAGFGSSMGEACCELKLAESALNSSTPENTKGENP